MLVVALAAPVAYLGYRYGAGAPAAAYLAGVVAGVLVHPVAARVRGRR